MNTHLHLDHIFGNPFMLKEFGLKAEANQADEFWIDEAPKQSRMFGFQLQEAPVPLGTYLHDGDIVTFGNTELEAFHVPGHSPGSLVYYCAADHCMFSGDVLFQGSIGRADLAGGNFAELIEHICSRLFILPSETVVYPGHGAPTTIGTEKAENRRKMTNRTLTVTFSVIFVLAAVLYVRRRLRILRIQKKRRERRTRYLRLGR